MPHSIYQSHPVIVYFYWGYVFTALFYGITLAQACSYFQTYPKDRRLLKSVVVVVMLFCSAQFVLEGITIYTYVVRLRGNLDAINKVPRVFHASMAGTAVVAFMVEIIYAVRIYQLSNHNVWLTGVVVLLALLGAGGGIAMVVTIIKNPYWDHSAANFIPSMLCLGGSVVCNVAITSIQVQLFRQHQSLSDGGLVRDVLTKLSGLVVSVGILTTADAVVFLATFLHDPTNGFFIVPYLLLCNCYLNSFLSLLNQRNGLRNIANSQGLTTFSPSGTLRLREITASQITSAERAESDNESQIAGAIAPPPEGGRSRHSRTISE